MSLEETLKGLVEEAVRKVVREELAGGGAPTVPQPVPQENGDADELWTPKQVAEYLKVSRTWVYGQVDCGALPCLRVGTLLRFEPEAVRKFSRGELAKKVVRFKRHGVGG